MAYYCQPIGQPIWLESEEQERHIFEYVPSTEYCPPSFPPPFAQQAPPMACYPVVPPLVNEYHRPQQGIYNIYDTYQSQPVPYASGGYVCTPPAAPPVLPTVYTMPQQPNYLCAPVIGPQPQPAYPSSFPIGPQPGLNYHDAYQEPHVWHGRTRWQVEQDNQQQALKEGVWKNNEATPQDPKVDQQFWCVEVDGTRTLRTADTIETSLRPGKWIKDPVFGNMWFQRFKKPE